MREIEGIREEKIALAASFHLPRLRSTISFPAICLCEQFGDRAVCAVRLAAV